MIQSCIPHLVVIGFKKNLINKFITLVSFGLLYESEVLRESLDSDSVQLLVPPVSLRQEGLTNEPRYRFNGRDYT